MVGLAVLGIAYKCAFKRGGHEFVPFFLWDVCIGLAPEDAKVCYGEFVANEGFMQGEVAGGQTCW